MSTTPFERFVDADEAGKFLSLKRRRILELARAGQLPSHSIVPGLRSCGMRKNAFRGLR